MKFIFNNDDWYINERRTKSQNNCVDSGCACCQNYSNTSNDTNLLVKFDG